VGADPSQPLDPCLGGTAPAGLIVPEGRTDLVHVVFKGCRIEVYSNPDRFPLERWQYVEVEVERGSDLGQVLTLDAPDLRRRKDAGIRRILRPARPEEVIALEHLRREEDPASLRRVKERVAFFGLPMHIVDAEHQFDGRRVTFYFTADHRIDFRSLVRDLAAIFRMRIELRQIGTREAARRLGGLGSCGRELCCRCMLCEFGRVSLQVAREQRLNVNPARLSGVCGRLLCCLNFEERDAAEAALEDPESIGPGE
jgi:cell fate regulator YaaT (PSP1 superfamily)